MITVGPLVATDRPVWTELFTGYNEFYGRTPSVALLDGAWREVTIGDRIHALGARLDERLVGITHFFTHPSTTSADVCYLQDLFTAEAARGRGVARSLIEAVADWAREQGCARVYWHTKADNHTARRLYDRVAEDRGFIQYVLPLEQRPD
ncbi:acetyltransferase (GNAT) family protein [Herbihabitans rhizosphaerae]|uniref:Acetyltransferase (GNAT) family protein n=1 Tax=Herbihabitans rhizosphaerae TaxID=1872711 RepID=A0A4Q7L3P6_9PSEU|nr:GNAT family N-acetyltransferase [Herbihabitans rhizosphaerae]RZS43814.1 acetyltransferase (GNAT) family protein [Herbihabitans rhizosphaerae]